jgi:hypothetical protein
MVSIHRTSQGWNLMVSEDLDYYSSLGDVMDAAYDAINRTADHYAVSAVRDCKGNYCGSSTGG